MLSVDADDALAVNVRSKIQFKVVDFLCNVFK